VPVCHRHGRTRSHARRNLGVDLRKTRHSAGTPPAYVMGASMVRRASRVHQFPRMIRAQIDPSVKPMIRNTTATFVTHIPQTRRNAGSRDQVRSARKAGEGNGEERPSTAAATISRRYASLARIACWTPPMRKSSGYFASVGQEADTTKPAILKTYAWRAWRLALTITKRLRHAN